MSDSVFAARPPSSLAHLKTRLVPLFGSEIGTAWTYETISARQGLGLTLWPSYGSPPAYRIKAAERSVGTVPGPTPVAPAAECLRLGETVGDGADAHGRLDFGRQAAALARRLAAPLAPAAAGIAFLIGAGALVALGLHTLPVAAPARPEPQTPAWQDIIKPVRIYNMEVPVFAKTPVTYTARRHTIGGGREDVLALGILGSDKPALRLRIFRRAAELPAKVPLFATLAHEAAQADLAVVRAGLPDNLLTRFGNFEVADVSVVRRDTTSTPCTGFRLALDTPEISISGLACGQRTVPLTRAAIGCLIERLDVESAGDDRALIDFFARSELRRNAACAGMRLGPDERHAPWLDDKPVTNRKRLRRR